MASAVFLTVPSAAVLLERYPLALFVIATIGLTSPIVLSFLLLYFPFGTANGVRILHAHCDLLRWSGAGLHLFGYNPFESRCCKDAEAQNRSSACGSSDDELCGSISTVNIVPILRKGEVTGWDIARPIVADFGLLVVTIVLTPLLLVPIC